MGRPWLGSKGSGQRTLKVSLDERAANYERIFGKKLTWLQLKYIKEIWLMS